MNTTEEEKITEALDTINFCLEMGRVQEDIAHELLLDDWQAMTAAEDTAYTTYLEVSVSYQFGSHC